MKASDILKKAIELFESGRIVLTKHQYFGRRDDYLANAMKPETIDRCCSLGSLAMATALLDPRFADQPIAMESYISPPYRGSIYHDAQVACREARDALIQVIRERIIAEDRWPRALKRTIANIETALVSAFNDEAQTSQSDVVEMLKAALVLAEKSEQEVSHEAL